MIRAQLQDELGVNPPDSLVSKACTKYGISNIPPPFHGIADSHQQSFVCIGHAIDVGLLRRLINFMMTKVRPIHHEVLTIRLKYLELPRGWIPFGSHFLNFKGKFSQPMIAVRKLAYFTNCIFGGLVPNDLIALTMNLLFLRNDIMKKGHSLQSVKKVRS